jgi:hypothetical protein
MFASNAAKDERERQRPFKIFISLLDKWEIGSLLTDVLVLDAFRALKGSLREGDLHDEVRFSLLSLSLSLSSLFPFFLSFGAEGDRERSKYWY